MKLLVCFFFVDGFDFGTCVFVRFLCFLSRLRGFCFGFVYCFSWGFLEVEFELGFVSKGFVWEVISGYIGRGVGRCRLGVFEVIFRFDNLLEGFREFRKVIIVVIMVYYSKKDVD